MATAEQTFQTYQDLATFYAQQGQAQLRDRFLVLAADTLHTAGRRDEAERVRLRLLQASPHHLLKPFASLDEAMKTADVKNYVTGLRRTYPPEKAAELLESLRSGENPAEPPASAPLNTLRPEPLVTPREAADALKVYRFQDEVDPEAPLPRTRPEPLNRPLPRQTERPAPPVARPVRPGVPAHPAHPIRSAGGAAVFQPARPPAAWNLPGSEADPNEPAAGTWVATGLFWVLLLAASALAALTLAGPFLPKP